MWFPSYISEKRQVIAMGLPSTLTIEKLAKDNVKLIVSLTEEWTIDPKTYASFPDVNFVRVPIKDHSAPTLEQQWEFIQHMKTWQEKHPDSKAAIHCWGGRGRTGTMAATWLVYAENLTASEAIAAIRKSRPKSIETNDQENSVHKFYEDLCKNSS